MNICIQEFELMKNKERDWNNVVVSIRLRDADATRFWTIMDIAKTRNHYADRTNVVRELLGMDKLFLLTPADIQYFRTGEKSDAQIPSSNLSTDKVEIVGKPLDAPYLNELGFDETSFADLEENKSAAAVRKKKTG